MEFLKKSAEKIYNLQARYSRTTVRVWSGDQPIAAPEIIIPLISKPTMFMGCKKSRTSSRLTISNAMIYFVKPLSDSEEDVSWEVGCGIM